MYLLSAYLDQELEFLVCKADEYFSKKQYPDGPNELFILFVFIMLIYPSTP